MKTKKALLKVWAIISLMGLFIIIFWLKNMMPTPDEHMSMVENAYKVDEFSGIITDKFIDKNEHNYKKIIIGKNNTQRVVLFDTETNDIFDFFMINDSVVKKKGSLEIRVMRKDLDTTLQIDFTKFIHR